MYKLNVSIDEKDELKRLYGIRWNPTEVLWYYPSDDLPEGLVEYLQPYELDRYNIANGVTAAEDYIVMVGDEQINTLEYKSVSQVNTMIVEKYAETTTFQNVKIKGEVTNYNGSPNNGNYYFSIKDRDSIINCFLAASDAAVLRFTLEAGQMVAIIGNIDFYKPSGKNQIRVSRIYNIGDGAINLEYLQLKERLRAEGLFDAEHKKPVPRHANRIGLVTSAKGEAIEDLMTNLKRTNPYVKVIVYYSSVQGVHAPRTIVEGIQFLDNYNVDLIIVGRGGGSPEERITFNDERIARAIYNCVTPIVTAIGHTSNVSLADEVSDETFTTPTEAAIRTTTDVCAVIKQVDDTIKGMDRLMQSKLQNKIDYLDTLIAKREQNSPRIKIKERIVKVDNLKEIMKKSISSVYQRDCNKLQVLSTQLDKNYPGTRIKQQKIQLDKLKTIMKQNMINTFNSKKYRFEVDLEKLHGLSPSAKLINGFGYVTVNGKALLSVSDVNVSDKMEVIIHDGVVEATVDNVTKNKKE